MANSTQNIASSPQDSHEEGHHGGGHTPVFYVRIWMILVILLIVSVLGSETGIEVVTLIAAFGIAFVKAYLVAKNFMHLNIEKRYVVYLLLAAVAFIVLFFFGVAADVMKHDGQNWSNRAAKAEVERAVSSPGGHGSGVHTSTAGSSPHAAGTSPHAAGSPRALRGARGGAGTPRKAGRPAQTRGVARSLPQPPTPSKSTH